MPPVRALFAKVEAWLNRSQRENATVFVIVKTSAIATPRQPEPGPVTSELLY